MKIKYIISGFLLLLVGSLVNGQTTAIPDANFEYYLETHDAIGNEVPLGDDASMGDGNPNNQLVPTDRISEITILDVGNLGISNLTGIEDFSALENLLCANNQLVSLDISSNTSLLSLVCSSNFLTDLDVVSNLSLESLDCSDNQLQNLNVSNNNALRSLTASNNQIQNIDISNNLELTLLSLSSNRILGELVVSNNTNLESLFCSSNQISILDLTANTLIKNLDVSDNVLTTLDLTTINTVVCPDPQTDPVTVCQDFSAINVSRNLLSSLVVANSYNNLITTFDATDNPDLFCIQIDTGFSPSGWIKDDWAYYSDTICADIYTYVPDDNFEQALIDAGYDDVIDNLVLTDNIDDVTTLNVTNASISSLIGIEDFEVLEILDCSANSIDSIDISANASLLELDASNNNLSDLDVSSNTGLTLLNFAFNAVASIDLSNNLGLALLNCANNGLTTLDISGNIALSNLDCSNNQIENLDMTSNVNLLSLLCNDNNLFALNVNNGNNTALIDLNAINNTSLFCINVDDVAFANAAAGWQKDATANYSLGCGTYLPDDNFEQFLIDQGIDSDGVLNNYVPTADIFDIDILDISNLSIADLTGIEDFQALENLDVSNNALISLYLEDNVLLQVLDCSMNSIESLDLTSNNALTSLFCSNNNLRTLNIENGNNNNLVSFDATSNTTLFCINVDDAIVGNIPMVWQKDDFAAYDGDCINNRFTTIPDPLFEQALIDLEYDDIIDGQVLTSNIEHIQILDVNDEGISDLTGIKDFKALIELDCSGNFLDELDVSDMIFLERLNCSSNYLLTNNIANANGVFNTSGTVSLIELYCASNNLSDLDTSQNINLEVLDCTDNNIATLNIDSNVLLRSLNCSNNALSDLNISNSPNLENVNCDNNQLNNLTTITAVNTTLSQLSCSNNELTDLLVNNYQGLVSLNCSSNALNEIVLSSVTALEYLNLTTNQLIDIDLSNNTNLEELLIAQNDLSQLVLSSNTLLEQLSCGFNEITQLSLGSNILLKVLSSSSNQLTALDLTNNINLIEINVSSNMLSSFILSNNLGSLKRLDISNNQIETGLDLSTMAISACVFQQNQTEFCPETISINIFNNALDFVNIQNGINSDINSFNASGNPNLECIQVDDSDNIPVNWIKDETTEYNEDCNFGETYVPDDNFEQALINLGYDVGPLNDYVPTANIEALVSLDVSGNAITDFTGIEDFIALEALNCSNNNLSELNLSSNINLNDLNCSENQLSQLDLSSNTALVVIDCSSNMLVGIDLIENTTLTELNIANNNFVLFIPSDVPMLQVLDCDNNTIGELDFQQNLNLIELSCQSNALDTLNLQNGENGILTSLNATGNPNLNCIQTDTGTVPVGATWTVDSSAQFAIECFFGQTYVPDDNFEQALIDLGYDSGPLNDYVLTGNIENLAFLNVSGYEISDVTGIEDFISLLSLDIGENLIQTIDLSRNTLLFSLDISYNLIEIIDISVLPNLTTLDVSNNSITELNINNNQSLINLNVSDNLISNIDVSGLFGLEDFSCAFNQITSLDFTQNPNLNILFCQSNLLVGDQLNLQNGNNDNLQIFNAANNPGLGCILVDDPVAIVNNVDGTYDNWVKDNSASYQIICEDADNDGVPNDEDLCPGTTFGAPVDLFGCAIIDLPNNNFMITVTGETCLNSNNGKITIVAQELYNYTVSLFSEDIIEPTGEDFYQEYNFTNDVDIFNLLAATYNMCITIEEWPDYEICYTIVITQPDPLEVFASRTAAGNEVSVDLSGSSSYHIQFNDQTFTTRNSSLTLQLEQGINTLKVSTDLDCQGSYEEKMLFGDDFVVYPNPFNNEVKVFNGLKDEEVYINIYSAIGQLVLSKTFENQGLDMTMDTSSLTSGMYIMSIQTETKTSSHKILKQ
ncbi:T9SS type A sorting domain-containing protein [Winogradskyella flava]|uniref:T9SS type A sorting domain-containing protein n=1 Tax=Winogradskyella flava TaxID=1884876 RepID=A0A842ISQ0_9FLAO|nr:T9SS type A sorting domain-containing protein [Winogradskyella flava]MBC2846050.1 T9SS type A sorting domain-containing protein [Winogradskyella flava]